MKRLIALLLLAAVLLCACAPELSVDTENQTMSDGKYTYTYTDRTRTDEGGTVRNITITYPNGGIYWWTETQTDRYKQATYSTSGNYDRVKYTPGEDLVKLLVPQDVTVVTVPDEVLVGMEPEEEKNEWTAERVFLILLGLVVMGLGGWQIARPEAWWQWRARYWVKNGEPTDYGLSAIIFSGICECIIGVVAILMALFL